MNRTSPFTSIVRSSKLRSRTFFLAITSVLAAACAVSPSETEEAATSDLGEASGATLACPGSPAFASVPDGRVRPFVSGIWRTEQRTCDWSGTSCESWKAVGQDRPLSFRAPENLYADGHITQKGDVSVHRALVKHWTEKDGYYTNSWDEYWSSWSGSADPKTGLGQADDAKLEDTMEGGHTNLVWNGPMSIRVGSTCALLVESSPYHPPGGGTETRNVLQLTLAFAPAPDGGSAAPDGGTGTTDAATSDGGSRYDAAAAGDSCAVSTHAGSGARNNCCEAAHPHGVVTAYTAQTTYSCKAYVCASACSTTLCAAAPKYPDSVCEMCVIAHETSVNKAVEYACKTDPDCQALFACYDAADVKP
jgi:hypothetical protein